MNGLHCCAQILGVLLFIPWSLCQTQTEYKETMFSTTPPGTPLNERKTIPSTSSSVEKTPHFTHTPRTTKTTVKGTTTMAIPTTTSSTLTILLQNPKLILIYVVLILVCAILLISTLALTLKVCQLRRRLKRTGGNSECWMGMDKTKKTDSRPEAKEKCSLLTEDGKTNKDIDGGARKDDEGKVSKDVQNGEEKKVEGAKQSEKAATPAAPGESSPSSNPKEKKTISETTIATPPPSSAEDTGEPKKEP